MIEPGYAVLLLLNHDATLQTSLALIEPLQQRGADLIVMATTDAAASRQAGNITVLPVDARHPLLSPISFIVAGQLFALHWSVACGHNPDLSRGVRKVTVTL